jgi:hypothetical protein
MATVAYVTHCSSYLDGYGVMQLLFRSLPPPSSSNHQTVHWNGYRRWLTLHLSTFELLKLVFSLCVYVMRCVAERSAENVTVKPPVFDVAGMH